MNNSIVKFENIQERIIEIRGQKVLLDSDLAEMYAVETRVLTQAVKRNIERFPGDFMFQLTKIEDNSFRSQIVTLKRGQHRKYLPYVFTEQGVAMLSSVLRSPKAIEVNILIMRAFVKLREIARNTMSIKELIDRPIAEIKSELALLKGQVNENTETLLLIIQELIKTKPVPKQKKLNTPKVIGFIKE
jgi:phage regulator Rha-like protein